MRDGYAYTLIIVDHYLIYVYSPHSTIAICQPIYRVERIYVIIKSQLQLATISYQVVNYFTKTSGGFSLILRGIKSSSPFHIRLQ